MVRRATEALAAGKPTDAIDPARQALRLSPDLPEAHYALACGLISLPDHDLPVATAHLRHAVRLRPGYVEALNTLGWALRQAGDLDAATDTFAAAVRADPAVAEPHHNMGTALYEQGRLAESIAEHEAAVRLGPAEPKAHYNLALALLADGQWDRGWPEYEWRRHALHDAADRLAVPHPPWTGYDPAGLTLLVVCEQGLGDTLQFVRYVPLLADRGATVILHVQPLLREVVRSVRGVHQVVARGEPLPPFDAHVKLLSLPGLLGTRPDTAPAEVPYLRADPARADPYAGQLAGPGFKVGIAWQGSGSARPGDLRSVPLAAFGPLARVPGVRLFSLQRHAGPAPAAPFPLHSFDPPPDRSAAFVDTAALIPHLDLVVTCDTSVAHLAGALGARTWVALPVGSDWRWLRGRPDSVWYPTARLFRQAKPRDWPPLFDHIAAALHDLANPPALPTGPPPVLVPLSPGDLLDRLSILAIKARRLADPAKLAAVRAERDALASAAAAALPTPPGLAPLLAALAAVNEQLWHLEDAVRAADAAGRPWADLARRVYRTNDRRADLKRQVNALLGSAWGDQKEYRATSPPPHA